MHMYTHFMTLQKEKEKRKNNSYPHFHGGDRDTWDVITYWDYAAESRTQKAAQPVYCFNFAPNVAPLQLAAPSFACASVTD